MLLQRQGEAAYKKEGKDVTATNRAMALAEDWEEFKNGVTFQPLRPEEKRSSASAQIADLSLDGLATENSSKARGHVKRAAVLCSAVAAAALSAAVLHSRRS